MDVCFEWKPKSGRRDNVLLKLVSGNANDVLERVARRDGY